MRNQNLLSLFKRNRGLKFNPRNTSKHSPHLTGYRFAFFIIVASLLLATCTLNRSLAVTLVRDLTTQSVAPATPTAQPEPATIVLPAPKPTGPAASEIVAAPTHAVASLTATPAPTATRPPATNTPGVLATSDLLFISENRLLRWDQVTRYSSSLAENVIAFSTNASGSKIVLLRPRGVSANGNELFDLDILDLSSMQAHRLVEGTPRMDSLALSPDGARLAYQQTLDGKNSVFLLRLSDPANPVNLGACEMPPGLACSPLSWSLDSQSLLWADGRGLWVASAARAAAILLHDNTIAVPDPSGKTSLIEARFASPRWSPLGRFILVEVLPDQSNASWHAVLDSLTGRVGQVLDTYKLTADQASVSWLPNGELASARSSDAELQTPASIQVWDVLATNPALLVSAAQFKFPSGVVPGVQPVGVSALASGASASSLRLAWVQQSAPGHLLFGASAASSGAPATLYDLNLQTSTVTRLAELALGADQVFWAPDGRGALVTTRDGAILFITADGKEIIDLKLAASSHPAGFLWLPPVLRK